MTEDELVSLAVRMAKLFSGRDDAHGLYGKPTIREQGGKRTAPQSERRTVREPVTLDTWVAHLRGEIGLGVVPIRVDNTCTWGAIDIDTYQGLNHALLAQRLQEAGLPMVVCTSKSGGAHVYLFVGSPVPAGDMQDKLREVCNYLGLPPGTEIFPKQREVLASSGDVGNWLNMPYQEAEQTSRFAVKPDGRPASLEEFLSAAERIVAVHGSLADYRVAQQKENEGSFASGPPCLEYLVRVGLPPGTRNNGLFNLGVFARKAFPAKWRGKLREYNEKFISPPLDPAEVDAIISSLARKEYGYKCQDDPIRTCCDKMICRTREHGIGHSVPVISHISKIQSEPPIWVMSVDGERIEFEATRDWMEQNRFSLIVAERLHRVPSKMKDVDWRGMWNALLESVEVIPAPPDASASGEFFEHLNSFAERPAQNREQLLLGLPYPDDGYLWFGLSDLCNFLRQRDFKYERRQVVVRLRQIDAVEKQLKVKGKVLRCWGVRLGWFNQQTEAHDPREEVRDESPL